MNCEICSSPLSEPVHELFSLPSVTSDCRPWSTGRSVTICSGCGVMKRAINKDFATNIYADYKMFAHTGGADQINFSGEPLGRTAKVLRFVDHLLPKKIKSVLDIGSGSGAGLKAIEKYFPKAEVKGYEPTEGESRPDGKFDFITLFHVFEHVEDLHEMLAYVKSSLNENGHLLIQVPYALVSPFDLVVADHIWHFSYKGIGTALSRAGFEPFYLNNECIKKEITVLAKIGKPLVSPDLATAPNPKESIDWLLRYKTFLDGINEKIMIYGSAPAAAWAGSILGDKVEYYIDDDYSRLGASFNGKIIELPISVDPGEGIQKRLPVVAPFPDYVLADVKAKNPRLKFL